MYGRRTVIMNADTCRPDLQVWRARITDAGGFQHARPERSGLQVNGHSCGIGLFSGGIGETIDGRSFVGRLVPSSDAGVEAAAAGL